MDKIDTRFNGGAKQDIERTPFKLDVERGMEENQLPILAGLFCNWWGMGWCLILLWALPTK
eukprot:4450962-Amphidinium_carterae.1